MNVEHHTCMRVRLNTFSYFLSLKVNVEAISSERLGTRSGGLAGHPCGPEGSPYIPYCCHCTL